jgi:hypothetical protein
MPKNHKSEKISPETQTEALKTAKATQRPGQTKEQTKLIAQGIEKGIHQYKKQQKAKSRELNKKTLKASSKKTFPLKKSMENNNPQQSGTSKQQTKLPWILLILSWIGFAAYILVEYYLGRISNF